MRYIYQVTQHFAIGAVYFSSLKKAEAYCKELGCPICVYSDHYLRQYEDFSRKHTMDIKKEGIK